MEAIFYADKANRVEAVSTLRAKYSPHVPGSLKLSFAMHYEKVILGIHASVLRDVVTSV